MEDKMLAEESVKTKRAREKLKKQMEMWKKEVTPQALEEKKREMHLWIARHAMHRIALKDKEICLFDGNQNTAMVSRKVALIAKKLSSHGVEEGV